MRAEAKAAVRVKGAAKKTPNAAAASAKSAAMKAEQAEEEAKFSPFLRSLCPRLFRSTRLGRQLANVKVAVNVKGAAKKTSKTKKSQKATAVVTAKGAAMRTVKNVKVKKVKKVKAVKALKAKAKAASTTDRNAAELKTKRAVKGNAVTTTMQPVKAVKAQAIRRVRQGPYDKVEETHDGDLADIEEGMTKMRMKAQ